MFSITINVPLDLHTHKYQNISLHYGLKLAFSFFQQSNSSDVSKQKEKRSLDETVLAPKRKLIFLY